MRAFSAGGFGSGQRLPVTGFVVFGLITFWIYTVLRFRAVLREHCALRWKELMSRESLQSVGHDRLEALRQEGFQVRWSVPALTSALLAVDAALVAGWFYSWIVAGNVYEYGAIMLAVGISSALFYVAILIFFVWAFREMRNHELLELLLHEVGPPSADEARPVPSEDLMLRWEQRSSELSLFLVIALPLMFSPALGVHLVLAGSFENQPLLPPVLCFVCAAVFHIWGTALILRLYNSHLATEAEHARAPRVPVVASTASPLAPASGGHDVFLSHSGQDKLVADAICAQLEQSGIRVWIAPRDIVPGANWGEAIINALDGCRAMVVVFSTSANTSPQVLREVERAVGKGVAVIPFRIEKVIPSKAMEYFLSSPHWLDAFDLPLERHITHLADTIRVLLRADT